MKSLGKDFRKKIAVSLEMWKRKAYICVPFWKHRKSEAGIVLKKWWFYNPETGIKLQVILKKLFLREEVNKSRKFFEILVRNIEINRQVNYANITCFCWKTEDFSFSFLNIWIWKGIITLLLRRVWSWLRMNAGGVLNTCKLCGNRESLLSADERRTAE